MTERMLTIAAICNISSIVVVMDENHPDVQTIFASDVDFNIFTTPDVSLKDIITDDEVFVLSPYQLVQYLPIFMQIEPVVQEIVRPHLEMNFKFRNKHFVINWGSIGHLRRRGVLLYVFMNKVFSKSSLKTGY